MGWDHNIHILVEGKHPLFEDMQKSAHIFSLDIPLAQTELHSLSKQQEGLGNIIGR